MLATAGLLRRVDVRRREVSQCTSGLEQLLTACKRKKKIMGAVEAGMFLVMDEAIRAMNRERVFRDRGNAFDLPYHMFRKYLRLPKPIVMWLDDVI